MSCISRQLLLLLLLLLGAVHADATKQEEEEGHAGIHVASWKWDEVGVFYTFTVFVIVCGLAKIAFHHAHFLSSRVPESCLMILVGVLFGVIIYTTAKPSQTPSDGCLDKPADFEIPQFTPKTFFFVLLPPVILEAAYSLYDRAFADNVTSVLLFAVVGTLINTFSIGVLLFLVSQASAMSPILLSSTTPYDLTMIDCLVFSSLISAVDPVAVLAIFQEIGVNKDLYYLVFGESLFNDAVTVVLYSTMVSFSEMPSVAGGEYGLAVLAFFASSLGGLAIGVLFGLLTALLTRTTREIRVVEPLAILGIAYVSYLSAELFHFSGIISIIGCGLLQAHYALKNISDKSYTTVIYFIKMLSSTSDAIIFLFLGMVVVGDHHVWHTGFVLWTLALCLVCRFAGVFLLTALANAFRVSPINLQEQFLMAYGGLRGAVAFSLVQMLDPETVEPRRVFVTTTLAVIFFTVFIQGATIKPLVSWLKIKKDVAGPKQMVKEISENIISNLMAGVEEITGLRGDNYIRHKLEHLDEHYMQRVFLGPDQESGLSKLCKELTLAEHFAHLYGPVALVEDHNAVVLRGERGCAAPLRIESAQPRVGSVAFRAAAQGEVPADAVSITFSSAADLRRIFKNHPRRKFPSREVEQQVPLRAQLLQRRLTARAITAQVGRLSLPAERRSLPTGSLPTGSRLGHSELEQRPPDEVEGLDAILQRATLRRQRSLNRSETRARSILSDIRETDDLPSKEG